MKYTNRGDLLIAAGESIKMQEKAGIKPVCKYSYENTDYHHTIQATYFNEHSYEFPLAVVEGKPVFVGDELYTEDGRKFIAPIGNSFGEYMTFGAGHKWSWNPPKPRTVMVELTREDAEMFADLGSLRIAVACRKALEEQ